MPSAVETDLGPAVVGVFLNGVLQGAMGLQCCVYYGHFRNDTKWMQTLVYSLLSVNMLDTTLTIWWMYDALVIHFGADPSSLTAANWLFATNYALTGIIATMVQIFFAWRIQVLNKNMWLAWFIRVMALGSISCGLGTAIAVRLVPNFLELQRFKPLVITWFTSSVICDVVITSILTAYMMRHKTGIIATDQVMTKLTRLTITNGLLVTVLALANLIAFLVSPTGLYLVFNFPLAKLYSCSLMSTLNSRVGSKETLSGTQKFGELTSPTRLRFRRSNAKPVMLSSGSQQSGSEIHELADQKKQVEISPVLETRPSESSRYTTDSAV